MKFSILFVSALLIHSTHSAELTLEPKPFTVSHTLEAMALPERTVVLKADAKNQASYEIVSILDHGSEVKKGDTLVVFKRDAMDRKLLDLNQALLAGELNLKQAESDLAAMEKTTPEQLKRIEHQAQVAKEEHEYFIKTRREAETQTADHALKRQRQLLESYEEELKQLLKMYEADDLTEDTEEIILKKQRDNVEYAKFLVEMEILDHKRKISVSLPREELALAQKRDDSALQLEKAKQDLPRALELKKAEVAKLKTVLERQKEERADLEHDLQYAEIKASEDGWFYHGAVEKGTWTTAEAVKLLTPRGAVPAGKVFATLVPAAGKLLLHASASQADVALLKAQAKGFATLTGLDEWLIPVSLESASRIPRTDGKYGAVFSAAWPESFAAASGQSYEVKIVSHHKEQAIAVPAKALKLGDKGWTIEVKMADGKTERRPVSRGMTSGDLTEITDGLKAGEVVLVP